MKNPVSFENGLYVVRNKKGEVIFTTDTEPDAPLYDCNGEPLDGGVDLMPWIVGFCACLIIIVEVFK